MTDQGFNDTDGDSSGAGYGDGGRQAEDRQQALSPENQADGDGEEGATDASTDNDAEPGSDPGA